MKALVLDAPIFRATITNSGKLKNATALNPSTELKPRGNKVTLRVEDIHEVVTLNY